MCGFLGEFSFKNSLTPQNHFDELLALSKHRGPDNTEVIQHQNFQLGFNRLAIIDTSEKGNQPKKSPSGRYFLVFNGEVYNFKELLKKYNLKNLESTSDTEVIIHLLDKLGIQKTIKQLNGMFAIAIVDTQKKTLSLTRDFAGIKPFFYGKNIKGIVVASQFNQVYKHPWFSKEKQLRPEIIKEYFGFGYMQAPNTIYKNIYQVNPGELLTFSIGGEVKRKVICQFPKQIPDIYIPKNESAGYLSVLKESVKQQLVSDVPIATFLSGGIDSPLITSVAKEIKPAIEAFTFGIDHPKYDESKKAIEYAKHIGVKHTLKKTSENELLQQIENHFDFITEPFGDYSSIPTYVITKKAKVKHTVMLSGDGADELFFGYPRMLDVLLKKHWFLIPFAIRKPIIKVANKLGLIHTWAPFYYKTLEEWIIAKQLQIFPDDLDILIPKHSYSVEMQQLFKLPKKQNNKQLLHWLRWNEFYGHLQRILIKVDRTSMGNSLEVRVPFLDKKSIDYALRHTPLALKKHSQLKAVLKQSLEKYFPKKLIQQQKKGFSVPIEDWLKNELKEDVLDHIHNKPFYGREYIDVQAVKNYVTEFYEGKNENGWGIWHIYAWQKWAYRHVLCR